MYHNQVNFSVGILINLDCQPVAPPGGLLQGTLVNRTYLWCKQKPLYIFIYFYQQYFVLFTIVLRNSGYPRIILLALVLDFDSCRGEILNIFAKKAKTKYRLV